MSGNRERKLSIIGALFAVSLGLISGAPVAAQSSDVPMDPDTLDSLARDVIRLESLRAVKDLQRSYAQYAQFGLWPDMAALFSGKGRIIHGGRVIEGRAAIAEWLAERGGPVGLAPGALNALMIDDPLVNLSADGNSAKGRWRYILFHGDGKGTARIEGGLNENDYVLEDGRWKIATLHFYPQYEGDYEHGWGNAGGRDLPIVPSHFDADSMGVPIPQPEGSPPESGISLAELAKRVAVMNDKDSVRNLQSAYGYYVDRKMWRDVVDLFTEDGVMELAGVGTFKGHEGIRSALERMGPAGLSYGQLNDYPQFDVIVTVSPGGREAHARGMELGMLGEAEKDEASWEVNVFRNRFIKDDGIWKIREMRVQPLMKAEYDTGWGDGGGGDPSLAAMPAFLDDNPVTGEPVSSQGRRIVFANSLTGTIEAGPPPEASSPADIRRRYMRSLAYDGTMNVSAAYGYYLDDFQWPQMAGIFAVEGNKQSPFAGYYFGRDRIAGAATAMYGETPDPSTVMRARLAVHWRIQPVILVSHDGRSATLRTRLFQLLTGKHDGNSGELNRNAFYSGMYPNDQVVLEDGVWRMWTVTIDEHYFSSPSWQGGWSAAEEPPADQASRPSPLVERYPPDVLMTELGRREEGFRGGTGETISWPGILPMWFHYRNPVSGREPERFWPDCVPCELKPEASMTRHGYDLPPAGRQIDGTALPRD